MLALPRGGVPVGYEVARVLETPLDVFVVRKLGVPGHEELAMGAIASGGVRVLNPVVIRQLNISQPVIDAVAQGETRELQRRELRYRNHEMPIKLEHRIALLVDDGLATGATMRAAIAAVRQLGAGRIVVAVPVAAVDTAMSLESEVDELVCPLMPDEFHSVGHWYDRFDQTTDEEVRELLARASSAASARDANAGSGA